MEEYKELVDKESQLREIDSQIESAKKTLDELKEKKIALMTPSEDCVGKYFKYGHSTGTGMCVFNVQEQCTKDGVIELIGQGIWEVATAKWRRYTFDGHIIYTIPFFSEDMYIKAKNKLEEISREEFLSHIEAAMKGVRHVFYDHIIVGT